MKLVYDEWYGELSFAQRQAYRKHNVSPSDHDVLVSIFGTDAHKEITAAVKAYSRDTGLFSYWDFARENGALR